MKTYFAAAAVIVLSIPTCALSANATGFLYDGTTWTTINPSKAGHSTVYGIEGNLLAGTQATSVNASDHKGFVYDLISDKYTDKTIAGANQTFVLGIDGGQLFGHFFDDPSVSVEGFVCDVGSASEDDMTGCTTIAFPGGDRTSVTGKDGFMIVGTYSGLSSDIRGFYGDYRNSATWESIDVPNAARTDPGGIEGNLIVGSYTNDAVDVESRQFHGFEYNLDTNDFTYLVDAPNQNNTFLEDVSGGVRVGFAGPTNHRPYDGITFDGTDWDTVNRLGYLGTAYHGFDGTNYVGSNTVPEPTPPLLLVAGLLWLAIGLVRRT